MQNIQHKKNSSLQDGLVKMKRAQNLNFKKTFPFSIFSKTYFLFVCEVSKNHYSKTRKENFLRFNKKQMWLGETGIGCFIFMTYLDSFIVNKQEVVNSDCPGPAILSCPETPGLVIFTLLLCPKGRTFVF